MVITLRWWSSPLKGGNHESIFQWSPFAQAGTPAVSTAVFQLFTTMV
ncbi:hypothetical protein AS9A_P20014 (plasmid) [Hoyosella subflava DQS3-9A1]|uniref:Uncharacterized protein n=1 Tax=Hoyosella subflava (strain DSM 45089 / JCM 17490 / NBRC 109087 / DQS3-9A1) TaxID=443218 RepID=F6ESD7_HOYSD|nr:hypothetical protein AS9A_P20014 [Hoyosella subflava DQS3-9A1]